MNRLFVAYKPSGITSNSYLGRLKRAYGVKKAGFSGTLDPFAKGVLIVAFGSYTKLFRFLKKTPKRYRATLWLGAKSDSLDIEMIDEIRLIKELELSQVKEVLKSLEGELSYEPPIFSAKHIDGKRAYDLARAGVEVKLETINSTIYSSRLINYSHPFITFEASVSEGTYIRSLGAIIAKRLGVEYGSLSALERLDEGEFRFEEQKSLDIKNYLDLKQNHYSGDIANLEYGRVLDIEDLRFKDEGSYYIDSGSFLSIVTIKDTKVSYELGRVLC